MTSKRPLWRCPRCGHRFVTKNLWHSCVRVSLAAHLDAGLWLRRRVEHPRLQRVEDYGPLGYGHHFRLESPADIDDELQELMQEAYRVGTQELTRRKTWIN